MTNAHAHAHQTPVVARNNSWAETQAQRMIVAAMDHDTRSLTATAAALRDLTAAENAETRLREAVHTLLASVSDGVQAARKHTPDHRPTREQAQTGVTLLIERLYPQPDRATAAAALPPLVRLAVPGPIDWFQVFDSPAGLPQVLALTAFAAWAHTDPDLSPLPGGTRHELVFEIRRAEDLAQGGPGPEYGSSESKSAAHRLLRSATTMDLPAELRDFGFAELDLLDLARSHLLEHPGRTPDTDERLRALTAHYQRRSMRH